MALRGAKEGKERLGGLYLKIGGKIESLLAKDPAAMESDCRNE